MILIDQLNLLKHHSILLITYRFFNRLCILINNVVNKIKMSKFNLNLLEIEVIILLKMLKEPGLIVKNLL